MMSTHRDRERVGGTGAAARAQTGRLAGATAPWGSQARLVQFQTLRFSFVGLDARQAAVIDRRFRRFVVPSHGVASDIACRCWQGAPEVLPIAQLTNHKNEYQPQVDYCLNGVMVRGSNFTSSLTLAASDAPAHLCTAGADALPASDVVDNVLRYAAGYVALGRGGLLLHSAGVVIDNRAWLALGRSDAGKTTFARAALAAGLPILSDDINIVLPVAGGGFVAGTIPLTGDLREEGGQDIYARYPVAGLLWLQQDDRLACAPMAAGARMARVLACAPVVNADPFRVQAVLDVIESLLARVPMRVLHFRRDQRFADLLVHIQEAV